VPTEIVMLVAMLVRLFQVELFLQGRCITGGKS
jgi:hypothetical protein